MPSPLIPPDGGPVYAETDLSSFIAEPWNAISSLVFFLPAFYCLILIKGKFKVFPFLGIAIFLLILGGTGSTLYHAFRSSEFFLLLDVLPIQILTVITIIFFWTKIVSKKWLLLPVLAIFLMGKIYLHQNISGNVAINLSYLINGIALFMPALIFLVKTRFEAFTPLLLSTFLFIMAILFRYYDHQLTEYMEMGSHWLWHIFSAAGAGFLGKYLVHIRKREIDDKIFNNINQTMG